MLVHSNDTAPLENVLAKLELVGKSGWSSETTTELSDVVDQLSELGERHGWMQLSEAAQDLEDYLSLFLDGESPPEDDQIKILESLIDSNRSIVTGLLADAPGANLPPAARARLEKPRKAFMLMALLDDHVEFRAALKEHQFDVRSFDLIESLLKAVKEDSADLLILEGGFVNTIGQIDRALIERTEDQDHRTIMVVLSHTNEADERLEAMKAGADVYFPQPFNEATMLRQIVTLLTDVHLQPFKVLVVDDDRQQALIFKSVLRRKGVRIRVCLSGEEALEVLLSFNPDLILVDLYMPEMDGLQFTARVRDQPGFFTTPIVFLSGESDPQSRYDALALGGNDFLVKPIRPGNLVAAVWPRLRRARELQRLLTQADGKDEQFGLNDFARFLELGNAILRSDMSQLNSYIMQIELDNAEELEARYSVTETLELQRFLTGLISAHLRGDDMVATPRCFVFAVLVRDLSPANLESLANRLLSQLSDRVLQFGPFTFATAMSIGICEMDGSLGDINEVYELATRARSQARAEGGSRWVVQGSVEDGQDDDRSHILDEFLDSEAPDEPERIHFQPLVMLHGHIEGQYRISLSLSRLDDDNAFDAQAIFFDSMDSAKRMKLDRWLISHGLEKMQQFKSDQLDLSALIPVSAETIVDAEFCQFLKETLESMEFEPSRLTLVVDLNKLLTAVGRSHDVLEDLFELGVSICAPGITGTSSELQLLERLKIAGVELDPKFLSTDGSENLAEITRKIADLGLWILMPEIGHAADMALLWKAHIDYARGDFISAPTPVPDYDFSQ